MNIVINFGSAGVRRLGGIGLIATLLLAGCGSSPHRAPGSISVVASTNVYGDIAAELSASLEGRIEVSSIITDPSADPHSYEANPRNELAISRADLIIENGGGYDDFMDTLRKAAGSHATLVNAVDVSGKPQGSDFNEHLWYDFPTMAAVAARITPFLIAHDRADAATLRANARAFAAKLHALETTEAQLKAAHRGAGVAITEPVPLYLLDACGLVNRTPPEFSRAVEEETDVSPRVLQSTLGLFSAGAVQLVVYNAQTSNRATDEVLDAARSHDVPVVPVTETLPSGKSYLSWMRGVLDAVRAGLT